MLKGFFEEQVRDIARPLSKIIGWIDSNYLTW